MTEETEKLVLISVRVPEGLRDRLAEQAKRNFRDMSKHIRAILTEHCEVDE